MICPNCGAEFDENLPKCPYCEELSPVGAEKKHMQNLYNIEDSTEKLSEVPEEEFKKGLLTGGKTLIKMLIAGALALAIIIAAVVIIKNVSDKRQEDELRREIAFRKEYFSKLDDMYDDGRGDFEAIREYIYSLDDEPGSDAIYEWKHLDEVFGWE